MARRIAFQPSFNHAAHRLTGWSSGFAPRAAEHLDERIPFAGQWPVMLPDGQTFLVVVDESSHPSTFEMCRHGFLALEPEVRAVFIGLLKETNTVVDIGANVGAYTMAAATLNPNAEVIAFEPLPAAFDRLLENCTLNQLHNIVCVHAAVGDSAGIQQLISPAGLSTTASREAGHRLRHPWAKELGPYTYQWVPVVDFDSFAEGADLSGLDLVKIDVELAELDVLRGMSHTLREFHPHIICELCPEEWTGRDTAGAVEEMLSPLGYRYYSLSDGKCCGCSHIRGNGKSFNFLFSTLDPDLLAPQIGLGLTAQD